MGYLEILERFPPELRGPISDLIEAVEERIIRRIGVTKEDFSRLESIVEQLAQAQKQLDEARVAYDREYFFGLFRRDELEELKRSLAAQVQVD